MPTDRDETILQRLGEWRQKEGSLPQFVELYEQLLRLQAGVKSGITLPEPALSSETAAGRLRQGLPLLEFGDLSLDWDMVQGHLLAIVDAIAGHAEGRGEEVRSLRNLASDVPLLQQVAGDWYKRAPLSSIAAELCVGEGLLVATIHTALCPFLTAHSEASRELVDQYSWRLGNCPICGGKPDFAFLDRELGARWLLCSRCDTEWLFQRLECPYCGTRDKDDISYMTDDREIYRLYTCDRCHSYIKAIDLRKADDEILLLLERVLTMDMDRQGEEAGYRPG